MSKSKNVLPFAFVLVSSIVCAQSSIAPIATPTLLNLPTPPISSAEPVEITAHETLSLASGSTSIFIPSVSLPQRGGKSLTLGFTMSGNQYSLRETRAQYAAPVSRINSLFPFSLTIAMVNDVGLGGPWGTAIHPNLPTLRADLTFAGDDTWCMAYCSAGDEQIFANVPEYCMQNWTFTDWDGSSHTFPGTRDCSAGVGVLPYFIEYYPLSGSAPYIPEAVNTTHTYDSNDDSFYTLDATNASDIHVVARNGTVYHFGGYDNSYVTPTSDASLGSGFQDWTQLSRYFQVFSSMVDVNGNTISSTSNAGTYTITDTVGRKISVTPTGITYDAMEGATSSGTPIAASQVAASLTLASSTGYEPWPYSIANVNGSDSGPCRINGYFPYYLTDLSTGVAVEINAPTIIFQQPSNYLGQTVYSLTLANLSKYQFTFDVAGNLIKVQYPTGGYTRYDYGYTFGENANFSDVICGPIPTTNLFAKHECTLAGGTCSGQSTTYTTAGTCVAGSSSGGEATTCYAGLGAVPAGSSGGGTTATITDPEGNVSIHESTGNYVSNPSPLLGAWNYIPYYETYSAQYSGASNLLRSVTNNYSGTICIGGSNWYGMPCSVTTTYSDISPALSSTVSYQYDSVPPFNVTQIQEQGFSGSAVRTNTALWNHSGIYADVAPTTSASISHILDRPISKTVTDNIYGKYATTAYTYDAVGNPWTVTASGTGTGSYQTQYNGAIGNYGSPTSVVDPRTFTTTYKYTDNWYDSICAPGSSNNSFAAGNTNAYITQATDALGHSASYSYYSCTGQLAQVTDPNLKVTTYTYDDLGRWTSSAFPDGGITSDNYTDTPPMSIATKRLENATTTISSSTTLDGFGRKIFDQLPNGAFEGYGYDANGNLCAQSNLTTTAMPTSGLSCTASLNASLLAGSTDGITYSAYDPLKRVTSITYPDSGTQTSSYSGTTVLSTDEVLNQWSRTSDALGRLVTVLEPNGVNKAASMETDYGYDGMSNLYSVTQYGGAYGSPNGRTRGFAYDGLSRLLTAQNPETGTICYGQWVGSTCANGYDGNSNLVYKTDARGVATNYSYDALNRLLSKTYTNAPAGTMSSCYQYDSAVNGNGRLGASWTQAGGCSSAPTNYQSLRAYGHYDAMGRALTEQQCTTGYCTSASVPSQPSANCTSLSSAAGLQYCYDLAGNPLAYSNGLTTQAAGQYPQHALLFAQTFDSVGRLNSLSSSWSDPTHPQSLFSAPVYTPFNALSTWLLGTQLTTSRTYDTRLRVTGQSSVQ
jgi:YD repeat-containing protein